MRAYVRSIQGDLTPEPHALGDALIIEFQIMGDISPKERARLLKLVEDSQVIEISLGVTVPRAVGERVTS